MAKDYDLVIIGGGTGGYVAAIRASQLGMKTAVVERDQLGGTCLHRGCIPSKALLKSAKVYKTVKESLKYGVSIKEPELDFAKVMERKNSIIQRLHQGVQYLMKKGKIDIFYGTGRILGPSIFSPLPGTVSVEMKDGTENEMLIPKFVLLATGSSPRSLKGLEADGKTVLTSDHALEMESLPASIIIIGGGVIGIEWASMLADFGTKVSVVEYAERILPTEDEDISREMTRVLKKKGVQIFTNAQALPETLLKDNEVSLEIAMGDEKIRLAAEKILVSVGRSANTDGIGLENTDIQRNNGFIKTNEYYRTKESHIYAIGDCIGGLQLAHVAMREGIIAVEHMAGLNPDPLDSLAVPKCVYSDPEVASIGYTEKEAKELGFTVKTAKFPFKAIGKALIEGDGEGFVKIIADEKTKDLLGVHLIGPGASDLISEMSLAKILDATPWEISYAIHPHPSLSEIFQEAGLAVEDQAIHG